MITEFVKEFASLIAEHPEDIEVEKRRIGDNFYEIYIYANQADTGKLIGRSGKMINSLKTIIGGCKAKEDISYKVSVKVKR
jgi:predicted RNA-binding protein YlqC (UPF0109 family)